MQGDRPTERPGNPQQRASENARKLDRSRYPRQFTVQNRFGLDRPLGFGVEVNPAGKVTVVGVGPDYWTLAPETFAQMVFAMQGVLQDAEDLSERLREQQDKPES